jgi:hypothetical protein
MSVISSEYGGCWHELSATIALITFQPFREANMDVKVNDDYLEETL